MYLGNPQQQHRKAHFNPNVLPSYPYVPVANSSDASSENKMAQCTVCMSEFEKDQELRLLPCLHSYHKDCIDPWLYEHGTCPVCNQDVTKLLQQGDQFL